MAKDGTTGPYMGTSMPTMPSIDMESLIAANQSGLKAVAEAQEHMLQRMAKVNGELFRFVGRRLEQDRATAKALTSCKSPQDAVAVYGKFFETVMKQYSEEMRFLTEIYSDQAREAMEDIEHQVEEAGDPGLRAAER